MQLKPPKVPFWHLLKNSADDPLAHFREIAKFGDIVQMPLSTKRYLINDPESIQRILQINFDNYTKEHTHYQRLREVLGPGLLTNSDAAWEKRRHDLQAAFHLKNLNKFSSLITTIVQSTLDEWEALMPHRHYFNFANEMLALVARISSTVLFGLEITQQTNKMIKLVDIGNDYVARTLSMAPWLPSIRNLRFRLAYRSLDKLLLDAFQHQRNPKISQPLLGKVIVEYDSGQLSSAAFLGDIKNFLVAGFETTGNALAWTMYCLLQKNTDPLQRLQQEIDQVLGNQSFELTQLANLPYTEMVLEESLRMYPPIWGYERRVIADDELGGYYIPAGSLVIICPYTMHRHPGYWPEPDLFNPERFNTENSQRRPKCAYIPFGTGPRVCIGKQLAMLTAKIVLTSILQRFNVTLAQHQSVKAVPLITLKPQGGISVAITPR